MKNTVTILSIILVAASLQMASSAASDSPDLVRDGRDGLEYSAGTNGDRIPDFSYCGYYGGGVPLPRATVKITLEPGNGGDDTQRIQDALDRLGASSRSDARRIRMAAPQIEALLLKTGTYRVSGTLKIEKSGVVLRGEGSHENGTVIIATGKTKRALIQVDGGIPGKEIKASSSRITDRLVPVGARTFTVDAQKAFQVGDPIVVFRIANAEWIKALGTDKLNRGPSDDVKNWTPDGYDLSYERVVTAVKGTSITIDAPIVCAIDANFGGGVVYKTEPDQRIHDVGIENLRIVSEYQKGKEMSDEEHAWDGVKIGSLRDGWVQNITAVHFGYSCVNISPKGKFITVQDCACLDPVSQIKGGRRYSFALAGQLCLMQRCYTRNGRHDYVMLSRVPGPNVFLDCVADETHADSGPHHRWSTGTLYDNIACGALNVQNRGRSGTGHGWAGANMVFWNCRSTSIDCQKPPTANNYCIGCTGTIRGSGHVESKGTPVRPRSLYLKQLHDRLGLQAVKNVATEAQLSGTVDHIVRQRFSQAVNQGASNKPDAGDDK